ncbi:conserved hypothetical protein [Trichinella spiralis]|uniref:hypothetical protein n=1 Tax=Trichinella spiralis TaxID=6334 RepID=UPI0001EFE1AB|nr:conserved hypothetical protein [Trichinella spiralis]
MRTCTTHTPHHIHTPNTRNYYYCYCTDRREEEKNCIFQDFDDTWKKAALHKGKKLRVPMQMTEKTVKGREGGCTGAALKRKLKMASAHAQQLRRNSSQKRQKQKYRKR